MYSYTSDGPSPLHETAKKRKPSQQMIKTYSQGNNTKLLTHALLLVLYESIVLNNIA